MGIYKAQEKVYSELEIRPGERIPYVSGRKTLRVDYLYAQYRSWKQSSAQIARSKNLPEKTIQQAIAWCQENSDLVFRVWEEGRKRAGLPD